MNYRDIRTIQPESKDSLPLLQLSSLFINVPDDVEESRVEGRKRGEEYLFNDVVFSPGKYRVEVWNETDRIYDVRKISFHKLYNFGNVKTIRCNTDQFDPVIFTAETPLVPPVLAFAVLAIEILDPHKPITFEMEIFDHTGLNQYIRLMMDRVYPHFRYGLGTMGRIENHPATSSLSEDVCRHGGHPIYGTGSS